MTAKQYQENILQTVKKSKFGLNIKNIVEELGYSRTTITKYLKMLEEEGLVFERAIGQYRIWIHRDALFASSSTIGNEMIFSLLKHLESKIDPKTIKKLGKEISRDLNFSKYINKGILKDTGNNTGLANTAEILMKIIDSICKSYDDYTWSTPMLNHKKNQIILRMGNSEIIEITPYYFLIAGIIEQEINRANENAVKVNILQINRQQQLIDIEFVIK